MARLAGKRAIVTGAASGIGRASARLFAAEGAKLGLGDVNVEAGGIVAAEIVEAGGEATFFETDVGDEAAMRAAID
ncbi:MAG: SDR family NAD(P)-dependent oxidoreductase, partial [Alphaproteobacteria bacterium]|nr:SDR family NAD(P)-dependent oxidoreductase [Alphaproteobacteria bacterium]